MTDQPRIIRNNNTLQTSFTDLTSGDIICGRIRLHPGEEPLLTNLVERGIRLVPSGTTQLLSRSKVLQVRLLGNFMPPHTVAIYNRHDLLQATSYYHQRNISEVVLKLDAKNGGLGIHLFDSIETLYNQVKSGGYPYPFVIQPFVREGQDVRVIILGDHIEAYQRHNPDNFRKNLHCGSRSRPFTLTDKQLQFCREVMEQGFFPYAHLDLLLSGNSFRLMEINLRGGLRGARLTGREYQQKTAEIHERMVEHLLG